MFDPITLSLVGAGLGALQSKRDPIKGAMMGGLLGYAGGAGMGLLGGQAAGTAGLGSGVSGTLGAEGLAMAPEVGFGGASGLTGAAPSGLKATMDMGNLGMTATGTPNAIAAANPSMMEQVMGVAKPVGATLGAVSAAKSLFPEDKMPQIMPSPIAQPPVSGPQGLSNLASMNTQIPQYIQQKNDADSVRRMKLLASMRGA